MTIRQLLKSILLVVVLLVVFRFAMTYARTVGFSMPNPIVLVDDAAAKLGNAPTATPDADPDVRAADVSTDTAPIATPSVASDFITDADALAILAEVDQLHKLSREGADYTDFRYQIVSGNKAASAIMATTPGTLVSMRLACDDVCYGVYYVNGSEIVDLTPNFRIYVPEQAKSKFYTTWQPFSAVSNWDDMLGAQPTDILTQWIGTDLNLAMNTGGKIVVFSQDDEDLMVNTGVFASWNWAPSAQQ